jgi:hypothetical protein
MDVIPAIRTAPQTPRITPERLTALRKMPYFDYLRTREWRMTRDRALSVARYTCGRCQAKRELQVHHRSYANLGAELDSDLEVLCRGCHLGHHVVRAHDEVRLYVKLVSEALDTGQFDTVAELSGAVKDRCVELKIRANHALITAAIATVDSRLPVKMPPKLAALLVRTEQGQPFSHAEAAGVLAEWGFAGLMKHMPAAKKSADEQAAHEAAIHDQIGAEYRASRIRERRRPMRERLEEIFAAAS